MESGRRRSILQGFSRSRMTTSETNNTCITIEPSVPPSGRTVFMS
ncbi:hypothetical protein RB653_002753 [Dictyostelium firmibasis]|uniref:Uncharacterized protein n=1 Tax=Dictyostelium firmibasis TaxID=79012 RepID=A0AAN7YYY3_9MYCE